MNTCHIQQQIKSDVFKTLSHFRWDPLSHGTPESFEVWPGSDMYIYIYIYIYMDVSRLLLLLLTKFILVHIGAQQKCPTLDRRNSWEQNAHGKLHFSALHTGTQL